MIDTVQYGFILIMLILLIVWVHTFIGIVTGNITPIVFLLRSLGCVLAYHGADFLRDFLIRSINHEQDKFK